MVNNLKIIISFSFNILIFANNSNIKNNLIRTETQKNPLDYYISFNSCIPKTFNSDLDNYQDITIYEENNIVKFGGNSYTYSSNIFLININNNNFLFA